MRKNKELEAKPSVFFLLSLDHEAHT